MYLANQASSGSDSDSEQCTQFASATFPVRAPLHQNYAFIPKPPTKLTENIKFPLLFLYLHLREKYI